MYWRFLEDSLPNETYYVENIKNQRILFWVQTQKSMSLRKLILPTKKSTFSILVKKKTKKRKKKKNKKKKKIHCNCLRTIICNYFFSFY